MNYIMYFNSLQRKCTLTIINEEILIQNLIMIKLSIIFIYLVENKIFTQLSL